MDINGSIKVETGFEGLGFDFRLTNREGSLSYLQSGGEYNYFTRYIVDANVTGKAGIGIGLTIGLPRVTDFVFDSMVRPYAGLYYDFYGVLDGKYSVETSNQQAEGHLKGSLYFESQANIEGYAIYLIFVYHRYYV